MTKILFRFAIIGIVMFTSVRTDAQVGVDNTDPDPSAVLDLNATDKGLLIPRMTSSQRQAIVSPANSLLVFDSDLDTYFYFHNGQWRSFDRWRATASGSDVFYNSGNVGIGTASPNAPLHFSNATANRKIVLYESGNNDHEFYGFGVGISGSGYLRYQVPDQTGYHAWYAGTSSTTSTQLMGLTGAGNLGLGITPEEKLHLNTSSAVNVLAKFTNSATSSNAFRIGINSAGEGVLTHFNNKPIIFEVNNSEIGRLTASGLGIGTSSPHAPLQFGNGAKPRAIVFREYGNNDHQFNGFGYTASGHNTYHVPTTGESHLWYAGTSSTTSNELMQLTGAGMLQVSGGGHFRGWVNNAVTGLGVDVGIDAGEGYVIAFDRTASTYSPLNLAGHASNASLRMSSSGNVFTGKVGIGVAPAYDLDIATSGNAAMQLRATGSGGVDFLLTRSGGTPSSWDMYLPGGSTDLRFYHSGSDRFVFSPGGIGTGTDWVATSDRRLKENFKPVGSQLDFISNVSTLVSNYDRKDNGKNETGFIAQELAEVAPEYVQVPDDPNDMLSVNYAKMVVPLYKGTAELAAEVERLKEREKKASEEIHALNQKLEETSNAEMKMFILVIICGLAFARLSNRVNRSI